MEISIDANTIKEIEEIIIPSFVEHYANKCTDISAIAIALQAILEKTEEIKKNFKD